MQSSEPEIAKVVQKWGFGMAIPKLRTHQSRICACQHLLHILQSEEILKPANDILESLSIVKGMFSRIYKQDQWDWFTVSGQLGYPSGQISRIMAAEIGLLRTAIKCDNLPTIKHTRNKLLRLPTRRCLSTFVGKTRIRDEPNAGWIYILSTREMPSLLKIGMTTRSVEERVREINSATGIAIPFGVWRCWRVITPNLAESLIHNMLKEYRLRGDREFFQLPFARASREIASLLRDRNLEIRTLDALAALAPNDVKDV